MTVMTYGYDSDWIRDNRALLITEDTHALDSFNAAHVTQRKEWHTWPDPSSMTTPTTPQGVSRIAVQPKTTGHAASSGWSHSPATSSACASSGGRWARPFARGLAEGGAVSLIVALIVAWYVLATRIGGA